jgi:hypothetical protein
MLGTKRKKIFMKKYDIAIVYRIYPGVSKIPPVFKDDKYKLSELCLASFRDALDGINFKLFVILDACPPEYKSLFEKYFPGEDVEYFELEHTGNAGTFGKQMDILLEQDYADVVCFAEDDYFYMPDAFSKMLDFINSDIKPDFVTPFDHLDYYNLKLHQYTFQTIETAGHKWRTAATTCMTFMTKKETLKETEKVFRTYTKNNYDASLWMSLTKINIFNPLYVMKVIFSGGMYARIFVKMWLHTSGQLLGGKKYKLFAPKPSLSTHMDNICLAPDIDWDNKFAEKLKKINF